MHAASISTPSAAPSSKRRLGWAALGLVGLLLHTVPALAAVELVLTHRQTGGIYADGALNNHPGFQNYFVGYGTSPGGPRTEERRSFFIFDLPPLPPGFGLVSATLELKLPFGGLIFGLGPGVPGVDPIAADSTETFQLGWLTVPSSIVTSPTLTSAEGMALFGLMDSLPVAPLKVFDLSDPPVGPPGVAVPIPLALDDAGLAAVAGAMGHEMVFTGWMPSWSLDLRPDPAPPPLFAEASELIFGLTDVHMSAALAPKLTLLLAPTPVPEPHTACLLALGLLVLGLPRRLLQRLPQLQAQGQPKPRHQSP